MEGLQWYLVRYVLTRQTTERGTEYYKYAEGYIDCSTYFRGTEYYKYAEGFFNQITCFLTKLHVFFVRTLFSPKSQIGNIFSNKTQDKVHLITMHTRCTRVDIPDRKTYYGSSVKFASKE